jgi:hypothetical protein
VAYVDLPPKAYSDEDVQRLFDHERNRLLEEGRRADKERSGHTKIILDQPISFRGHPGREVELLLFDGQTSHTRMYFVAGRFYVLYARGKNSETFLDSFRLLEDG